MHYQRIVPFFQLTHFCKSYCGVVGGTHTSNRRPRIGAYSPKDFDDCRREGGSIVVCCRFAGGYLNQDETKCIASYLFRGPSPQGDGGGKKPSIAPKAPTQTERAPQ